MQKYSAHADGDSHFPGLRMLDPGARPPIDMSEMLLVHMPSPSKISLNPSEVISKMAKKMAVVGIFLLLKGSYWVWQMVLMYNCRQEHKS